MVSQWKGGNRAMNVGYCSGLKINANHENAKVRNHEKKQSNKP